MVFTGFSLFLNFELSCSISMDQEHHFVVRSLKETIFVAIWKHVEDKRLNPVNLMGWFDLVSWVKLGRSVRHQICHQVLDGTAFELPNVPRGGCIGGCEEGNFKYSGFQERAQTPGWRTVLGHTFFAAMGPGSLPVRSFWVSSLQAVVGNGCEAMSWLHHCFHSCKLPGHCKPLHRDTWGWGGHRRGCPAAETSLQRHQGRVDVTPTSVWTCLAMFQACQQKIVKFTPWQGAAAGSQIMNLDLSQTQGNNLPLHLATTTWEKSSASHHVRPEFHWMSWRSFHCPHRPLH